MSDAFFSSISGRSLNAPQTKVTANNNAKAKTSGYKGSRVTTQSEILGARLETLA